MSTINTSMGRYSLKAKDYGNHISGIYPITGGNREITRALRDQMVKAGFEQPH